ncbi:MAG: cystathionine gamma-synthase [Candidatus Micrarchaeota archaeon]
MKFSTRAVHVGQEPNLTGGSGDVSVPIHMASTFARSKVGSPPGGYEYSRTDNPTRTALQRSLAALEGAKHALAYASGLAAITNIMFLLRRGDRVLVSDDLYGGTYRLFTKIISRYGIRFDFVDFSDVRAFGETRNDVKMIWLETPTNPLLKIYDVRAISKLARENHPLVVVDNTFASPYFQNPLALGADIALHSTTKYISGHSDLIGGAIMTSSEKIFTQLKFLQNGLGAVSSPFNDWLVLRGIRTLHLRMERHAQNAQRVAEFLETHPKIARVRYPGLPSHPQHALARKQMRGFSGIVSFQVKGGARSARRVAESTKLFLLAESLGGVESLIEHPASMSHSSIPRMQRAKSGISDSLIRLSVGIENADDLLEDLERALKKI